MKEKEKMNMEEDTEEEEEEIQINRGERKNTEPTPWKRDKKAAEKLEECSLRDVRKDQLRKDREITFNSLFQWVWYFIENQKDAPEKLIEECKLLYGIFNTEGIKKEWNGGICNTHRENNRSK
jgi:hypothetical protein